MNPTYEFHCNDCDKTFEVEKPYDKLKKREKCPLCGKTNTRKIISLSSVIYNGKGFTLSLTNRKD